VQFKFQYRHCNSNFNSLVVKPELDGRCQAVDRVGRACVQGLGVAMVELDSEGRQSRVRRGDGHMVTGRTMTGCAVTGGNDD
jgi:hypothetical protein